MKKFLWLIFIGLLLSPVVYGQSSEFLQYDKNLIVGKLDNGLTYYIYPNTNPKGEAVYRLFVKAGSVMEKENQRGLAHFLEHMAFNGSYHFPSDGMVRFLESKGAKFGKDLNAHTSFNETVYKLQLPSSNPQMVDSTLTILADWAGGLSIDSMQVEKERGVILSEWLSKRDAKRDSDTAFLLELLNSSHYSERMTIGDTAVIRNCKREDILDYYQTWYHPSLMAVAVVGDINPEQVETLIKEKFGKLSSLASPIWKQCHIPVYKKEAVKILTNESLKTIELDMIQLLPLSKPVRTAKDYKAYLTRTLLNRLFKMRMNAWAFENPSYRKASIQYSSFLNATGVLLCSVELLPGKMEKGISEFIAQQQQIFRYGFTETEIEHAKKVIYNNLENKLQNQQSPASVELMNDIYADFYVGNRFTSLQEEYRLVQRYFPELDSVALVRNLAKVYSPQKMHYLLRANEKANEEVNGDATLMSIIKEARKQSSKRYNKYFSVPDELCQLPSGGHIVREENIPEIGAVSLWLNNGTRIIFKSSELDKGKVLLTGFRKGGLYSLDSLHYYTGIFAPSIISLSGAGNFSRDALNYFLAGNSASMRLLVDKTRTGLAGVSQVKDMETMFQLLYTKWMYPQLDTAICKQTIEKTKENYRVKQKSPTEVFQEELMWLLNGRNYTNTILSDSLITRYVKQEDMLPLFNRFYGAAKDYTFVILGDCTIEDIKPLITIYIGGLPKGSNDTDWRYTERNIPHKSRSLIHHTGDSPKASVSLIFQQDSLLEEFSSFTLKSNVMKAMLRTCLLNRLREEMGKVYSVSVASSAGLYPSFLSRTMIGFVCLPEDVDSLVNATQEELQRLYEYPESFEGILMDVKSNLLKDFELDKQKNSFWTSWIRNSIFNQQGDWKYLNDYAQTVNSITAKDISSFAKSLLSTTPMIKAVLYPKN